MLEDSWLGDHPMYKTVEGFVISVLQLFDDEDIGVSFDGIYEVVDDYQPEDSPTKSLQPSRKYIRSVLNSAERKGLVKKIEGLYYLTGFGQIYSEDMGHAELGWGGEGSGHGLRVDPDDPEGAPLYVHPDNEGEIILPINKHLWEGPKE